MAIDERRRHELHKRLEEVLDPETAATLMAHLPPVGWADVAPKADLESQTAVLEARIDSRIDRLETKLTRLIAFTNVGTILTVAVLAFGAAKLA